jgi:hypothetical protein
MSSLPHHLWLPPQETPSILSLKSNSESKLCYDRRSVGQSWNKAPIWGLRPNFYYCQTVAGLLMWGALSDERTCLSFRIVAGPHVHSHSRVRVQWDSRPYLTVSDSRLPFSSPLTTRRATVEIFDPAFIRGFLSTIWDPRGGPNRKHRFQLYSYYCVVATPGWLRSRVPGRG